MAASASPEDSEPLFVLEPLPELSGVIESFASANPVLLIFGFGGIVYFLTRFSDPMTKLWTSSLTLITLSFIATDSMFYSMIFVSIHALVFFLVWAAVIWDQLKVTLGMNRARVLSIVSFVVFTWILTVLGTAIGMPTSSGVVVCTLATAYIWWTYYSLEPARI